MRRAALLVLASWLLAQEGTDATLRLFADARAGAFAAGAEARLGPLIESLAASRDARAVGPLCEFVRDTLVGEAAHLEKATAAEGRRGADTERMQQIDREVAHLRARERSGADVGPDLARRYEERMRLERSLIGIAEERDAIGRAVDGARKLRERAAAACSTVLRGLEGAAADAAVAQVRGILGTADRIPALLVVQILRESRNPGAEATLLDVLRSAPAAPVARAAAVALAPIGSPETLLALLAVAERDAPPGIRAQVLHALGIRAQRQLETVESAREWVSALPR